MMKLFVKLFGPYPLANGYTVVVTDDDLEIPLEAQGISIFGANHCDGERSAERLIAHELAHQWFGNSVTARRWRDIWLHEGFACYAEWLWSEESGGRSADELARHYHHRLRSLAAESAAVRPRAARHVRRPGLQARRAHPARAARHDRRRRTSSSCCGTGRRGTATAPPSPTTSPGWPPTTPTSRCARCGRPGCTRRTSPTCDRRRGTGPDPGARSPGAASSGSASATVVSALCGYAVLYLAARDLEPAGFSVFAVFWGAFGLLAGRGQRPAAGVHPRGAPGAADHGSPSRRRPAHPARCGWPRSSAWSSAVVVVGHVAAVVGARVRRVAAAQRRAAGARARRLLPARDAARHAGRRQPLERSTARSSSATPRCG